MCEFAKFIHRFMYHQTRAHSRLIGIVGLIYCLFVVTIWFVGGFGDEPERFALISILPCVAYQSCILANTPEKRPPRIPDLPPVPREPHGATTLNQMLLAKFQKSR